MKKIVEERIEFNLFLPCVCRASRSSARLAGKDEVLSCWDFLDLEVVRLGGVDVRFR